MHGGDGGGTCGGGRTESGAGQKRKERRIEENDAGSRVPHHVQKRENSTRARDRKSILLYHRTRPHPSNCQCLESRCYLTLHSQAASSQCPSTPFQLTHKPFSARMVGGGTNCGGSLPQYPPSLQVMVAVYLLWETLW